MRSFGATINRGATTSRDAPGTKITGVEESCQESFFNDDLEDPDDLDDPDDD